MGSSTSRALLDKVYIRGGLHAQAIEFGAYWDAIMVHPLVDVEVTLDLSTTANVERMQSAEFAWTAVATAKRPPARQGAAGAVIGDDWFVVAGERASFEYSDVWKLSFATMEWSFVDATNMLPARHDHSVVAHGDKLVVLGGRGPAPLGDCWMFDVKTSTWSEIATPEGMAARFGHSAVMVGSSMYVYGGFIEGSGLTDDVFALNLDTLEWTYVGPNDAIYSEPKGFLTAPESAMLFPQDIPASRFSHTMVAGKDGRSFYVVGGAGGDALNKALSDAWRFDTVLRQWSVVHAGSDLAVYDAMAVANGDSAYLFGGIVGASKTASADLYRITLEA